VQLLFIDESGTPPPPNHRGGFDYFVLGGVVIPEDVWPKLAQDLAALKAKYRIDGEIKWRHFAPERKKGIVTPLSHLGADGKEALRRDLYEKLVGYKAIKLICVATDVHAAYTLPYIRTADHLYWYSYKQLTERFQYYLQDLEKTVGQRIHGIVVCDHRAPGDDERLRELHHTLLTTNRFNVSRYSHLVEGLFIAPSHLSVGIQFADMVAGAVFRRIRADDSRFWDMIASAFRRSQSGSVDGYGLVRFPHRRR
jgi:hypothetical protein